MTNKIKQFTDKLTTSIKNDRNFTPIFDYINSNLSEFDKWFGSMDAIDEIKNVDIKSNVLLDLLFEFETSGRGDKRGKGELLIVFLVKEAHFASDCDIRVGDEKSEVKAYNNKSAAVAFGVKNTFTLSPFGKAITKILLDIEEKQSLLPSKNFWFSMTNRSGGWVEFPKITKLIGFQISSSELRLIRNEIPKLKGIVNHPYVDDISLFDRDIQNWDSEFNQRDSKIVLFSNKTLINSDAKFKTDHVTQARIKMRLF